MPFITPQDIPEPQSQLFPDSFQAPQEPVDPKYYDQKAVTTGIATAPTDVSSQSLESHIDNTKNQLELGSEDTINTNLAYDQKAQDRATQQEVMKNAVITNDAETFQAVAQTYSNPQTPTPNEVQIAPYRGAVSNLQNYTAQENATQAKAQEQEPVDKIQETQEFAIKRMMVQDALNKVQATVKKQSLLDNFSDYAGLILFPLQTEYATSGNFPIKTGTPGVATGSHIQDENEALMKMPLQDFIDQGLPAFLNNVKKNSSYFGENPIAERQAISNVLNYSDNQASMDNVLSLVDHFTLGLTGGRALRSLSRTMVTMGSRIGSAELNASKILHGSVNEPSVDAAKDLVKGEDGVYRAADNNTATQQVSPLTKYITQTDSFTDAQHSGFVPNFELVGTNAPTTIQTAIDKQEALAARVNQLQRSPYLSPEQQAAAIERTVADTKERVTPQGLAVADSHMISQPNSATTMVGIKIGKTDGTGWSTEANARKAMERSGYGAEDFVYAKGIDNLHYPTLKTTVSGNGLTPPADIDKLSGGTAGQWRKWIQNTDVTDIPELERVKTKGAYTQTYLEGKVYQPLLRPASELPGEAQNILAKVVNYNMDAEKDLDITEFKAEWKRVAGRQPSDKEVTAYYSLRQANNVSFALDNRRVFEDFSINGFKDIQFNSIPVNEDDLPQRVRARRIENLPGKGSTRIYNDTLGETNPVDSLRAKDIVLLKEQGYHLFEVHDLALEGGPITHVLSKSADYIQHELSPFQVNYKPGTIGPRIYKTGFYLKQVRTHAFEDGIQYRGKDLTLFHGQTRTDLEAYATRWNKALDAFRDYKADKIGIGELEDILADNTQFETIQDFQKAIDDGMFTEHPMQVVRDGERPKFGTNITAPDLGGPSELSDFTIHAHQSGKLITSPRGERLTTPYGEKAPVLDVYSAVSRAASTAVRHTAFDVYKKQAIDKWFTTAQKLQVLKEPNAGASYNIFDKDPYARDINPDVKSKLETMRMSILRNLGQPVKSQQAFSATMEHIGDWIAAKDFNPFQPSKTAIKAYDLMSGNPLSALRGFVFHKTLGMFNPAQLVIQPSTNIAAISAHPIYGVQAAMAFPVVRLAMMNGSAGVLDYLAKSVGSKALHGMGEKEFKLYIKELKTSGIAENATSLAIRDQGIDTAISQSKANLGIKDVAEASSWFFSEGNKVNQLIGHGISWRKAKSIFGLKNISTPQARDYIASETTKLAISMKSTSAAYWQKGLLSWPTQFAGYTERLMNWVLPAFLGGDARFTAAQKARVFGGQLLFFGKYGVPVGGIASAISYTTGMKKEDAEKYEGGVMDLFASHVFGTDVSYSQRAGVGENVVQLIQNFSQNDFSSVMGGATYTGTSNFIKQLRSVVTLTTTNALENEDIRTADRLDAVIAMAQDVFTNNISSLSNTRKSMALYNYGKFITNTGKTVVTKPELIHDHLSALAVALSIPLAEAVKANDLYQTDAELKETENTLVGHISQFTQDYINASSVGDYIEAQKAMDRVQIMSMILPENVQQKYNIQKRVWKQVSKDLLQTEIKQNSKLQGVAPSTIPTDNNQ